MLRLIMRLAAGLFAATAAFAQAHAGTGGCEEQYLQTGYFVEDGKRVFDDAKFQVFSARMNTPVYKAASGSDLGPVTLGFDQKFLVTDPGEGTSRLRLRKLSDQDVGWVERDDLLCRTLPLAEPASGLLRRLVVQTETAVQTQAVARIAYQSPNGTCEGGPQSCVKLSRFQWYFVYGEENGHVLLSEAANLGGKDARLVGWLPVSDGINWNTAAALRPSEELAQRKAADGKAEAHVCAYPSVDAMKDPKACRPILGGPRWFAIETRLPILRDFDKVYEVAVSSAATAGSFDEAMSLAGVDALKNLDVFFVIDGTKSMQGLIDAIKGRPGYPGIVDQVREQMKGKIRQGGSVRFGYRVYRDSTKGGATGVEDEGLALGPDCGANEDKFVDSFKSVRAFDGPGDTDFEENLYGGLIQASRDIESCPDHLKLIVVIGDAGYSPEVQRQRGHKTFDADAVIQRFVRGRRLNTQPVVAFIQGPNEAANVTNKESYQRAYDAFRAQGLGMLKGVYGAMQAADPKSSIAADEFFFALPTREADVQVVDRIIARVDQLLQPDVIGRLLTRLKSGESLTEAITALQRGDKTNVPVLYWNVVADALCKRLGNQCTKTVLEGVFKAYLAHSPDLTHDVLLSQNHLNDWRELLAKFKIFWAGLKTGERSRNQLVNVLQESIGSVLKIEFDDGGRSFGEIAQLVGGLPNGSQSKLMVYTPGDLRNESTLKECEIQHLVNYAAKKADIIQIVHDGDKLAVFSEEPLPISACPTLTAKGRGVPHLPGAPRPRTLNAPDASTDYGITFRKGNDRYYWVPIQYLP